MRIPVELDKAVNIIARYKDFDGDLDAWKDAFYQVWRYQLTFDFAHEIALKESKADVYIKIICKPCYKDNCVELLKSLGCKEITEETAVIGGISAYDFTDDMNTPDVISVEW